MIKQVIWDFNGTILDDIALCLSIINTMLAKRNLSQLTLTDYRDVFDFPVKTYYQSVGFDFDREPFPVLAHEYMEAYQAACLSCGLREGMPAVLEALRQANVRQVLLSATKQSILLDQVNILKIDGYFEPILGLDDILGNSKRDMAENWFATQPFLPDETVMIGDTTHDDEVARQIGCRSILLTGGHNSRERLAACGATVLDHPEEVIPLLHDCFDFVSSVPNEHKVVYNEQEYMLGGKSSVAVSPSQGALPAFGQNTKIGKLST